MTPDEPPIPDDALAGAARRALGRLAADDVAVAPWEHVRAQGRRAQRVRATVAVAAALLIVLAAAGAVSATRGTSDHVGVAGPDHGGTTTTTTEAPTTTTTTTQPSVPPATNPVVGGTMPTVPVSEAQPADLAGTITVASTTWFADQPTLVALTLQNVSGHPVAFPKDVLRPVGLYIDYFDATGFASDTQAPLAPGEQRTFSATITPRPELIGAVSISAGYLQLGVGRPTEIGANLGDAFSGVAPVAITVVPPGWSTGDPLDPARGSWTVALTADSTTVTSGGTVTFHATVTNTGDQPQQTNDYDTLSLTYTTGDEAGFDGVALAAATIAPGASQTFDIDLPIKLVAGTAHCFVGIGFPPADTNFTTPHVGLTSNSVELTVVPAETTTSAP